MFDLLFQSYLVFLQLIRQVRLNCCGDIIN